MRSSKLHSGFTLIELVVVICVVAVLGNFLLNRIWMYQEMAEKAAMEQTVGALKSAQVLQYGHRMAMSAGPEMANIIRENPMEWLATKPGNYQGEVQDAKPDVITPGSWAFDKITRVLIYVPDHADHFEPDSKGHRWIRFHTLFLYEKTVNGKRVTGVSFGPVEPYKWLVRE